MDPENTLTTEDAPNWPEMSTDLSIARSVARAITLDTQRSSTDGRVMDLGTELQDLAARLFELEKVVSDQGAAGVEVSDLATELEQVRANLAATNLKHDELASKTVEAETTSSADPAPALLETVGALDERVATVEAARLKSSEEIEGLMEYLEQAFTSLGEIDRRVAELGEPTINAEIDADRQAELDELRRTLDEMRDVVATSKSTLSSGLTNAESSLAGQVGVAEENLAEQVRQVQEQLQSQVGETERNLAEQVAEARAHLIAQSEQTQLDLNAQLSNVPSFDALSRVDELAGSIDDLRRRADLVDEQIAAKSDDSVGRLDEIEHRSHDANERIHEATNRADDAHEQLGQISERVTEAQEAAANAIERLDTRQADFDDLTQKAQSASERASDAHTRLAEAHQRINETEERISGIKKRTDDADARFEELFNKTDGNAQRTDAVAEQADGLAERTDEAFRRADETRDQLVELHEKVDQAAQRADEANDQLASVWQRVAAAEESNGGASQMVSEATLRSEDALVRLDEAQQRLTDAEVRIGAVEETQRSTELAARFSEEVEAAVDERLQAAEDRLIERIEEARQQLAQKAQDSEESLAQQVKGVEDSLIEQVAETRIVLEDGIVDAKSSDVDPGPNVDPAEIVKLQEDIEGARTIASDAQRFSENLRVLQTDLVKAIQAELEKQSERLAEVESTRARVQHLETTISSITSMPQDELGIAPAAHFEAARMSAVESQLAEATSSIEGLAELQRRTTNLDTSLTQSMTNMTQTLEQNSAELRSVRAQLDAAQTRITQLEGGKRVEVAPPPEPDVEPTSEGVVDPGAEGLRVADVIGETTKNDRLTPKDDSDWFVTSYTKKEKGRRFRR